jgi:hypothetical protein
VAVNLDFRIPFGDLSLTGKIPLIRDTPRGLEIVNFKTGNHKADEFWHRTDMGVTLQVMAYQSMFKSLPDSICLQYLRIGSSVYVHRTQGDYKRLKKSIDMMAKTMKENWYYPRESYQCDTCPAKTLCMEWR